jgi:hypothetical protein
MSAPALQLSPPRTRGNRLIDWPDSLHPKRSGSRRRSSRWNSTPVRLSLNQPSPSATCTSPDRGGLDHQPHG